MGAVSPDSISWRGDLRSWVQLLLIRCAMVRADAGHEPSNAVLTLTSAGPLTSTPQGEEQAVMIGAAGGAR